MSDAKILIVEDEASTAINLESTLQTMGYLVSTPVISGEEVLKIIHIERPDLILMDINLAGDMDGIETTEKINEIYDTPVLYLTALTDHSLLERAKESKPFGYLNKPYKNEELRIAVEIALYRHKTEHEIKEINVKLIQEIKDRKRAETALQKSNLELAEANIELNATIEELETVNNQMQQEMNERRQAEDALRESEKKYQKTFRSNPAVMTLTRLKDGIIIEANKAFERVSRYSRDEIIGKTTIELRWIDEDNRVELKQKMIESDGSIQNIEFQAHSRTGEKLIMLTSADTIKIGEDDCLLVSAIDITKRKQLEEKLRQSHKMEAVGTLAGGIAHDFNNILGTIRLCTELSLKDISETNPAHNWLKKVLKSSDRARDLVKQILSFSRKSMLEKKALEIGEAMKEALQFIRSTIPTTIIIRNNVPEQAGTIFADSTQIHQIIINLCTNAVRAMHETGGVIEIKFERKFLDAVALSDMSEARPGHFVGFSVTDIGKGIPPELLDRIFEPFFTTANVGEGTGMGLAVVHGIVQDHGGIITVESVIDMGSVFHVLFPESTSNPVKEIEKETPIITGSGRILYAEDEVVLAEATGELLESLGYEVSVFNNGRDTLAEFKKHPDYYDIIITDQTMPDLTGIKLVQEIQIIRPNLPIILCTGYSDTVSEEYALQHGVSEYMIKPFEIKEMAETIRRILRAD